MGVQVCKFQAHSFISSRVIYTYTHIYRCGLNIPLMFYNCGVERTKEKVGGWRQIKSDPESTIKRPWAFYTCEWVFVISSPLRFRKR